MQPDIVQKENCLISHGLICGFQSRNRQVFSQSFSRMQEHSPLEIKAQHITRAKAAMTGHELQEWCRKQRIQKYLEHNHITNSQPFPLHVNPHMNPLPACREIREESSNVFRALCH